MRVGIDARLAAAPRTGIGSYVANLVEALGRLGAPEELVLFTDAPLAAPAHPGWETVVRPGRRRLLWTFGTLPAAARARRLDLLHGTTNFELPFLAGCPLVATVHDLIPLRYPEGVSRKFRLLFRLLIGRAVRAASRVIAVSEFTRREILERWPEAAGRVAVVPNGHDPAFTAEAPPGEEERIRGRYGLPGRYLLFVGVFEPRKNVPLLVDAFERLRATAPEAADVRLALAGGAGWHGDAIAEGVRRRGLEPGVRLLGYVPGEDLPGLYRHAALAVVPSSYEGFGIPVIEAMACGAPVLAADAAALPETVGGAGELFAPGDPAFLAHRIRSLLASPARLADLRARGLRRASDYTWDGTARGTLEVYREAVSEGPAHPHPALPPRRGRGSDAGER